MSYVSEVVKKQVDNIKFSTKVYSNMAYRKEYVARKDASKVYLLDSRGLQLNISIELLKR